VRKKKVRKPIVVLIHGNPACAYHPFGAVHVTSIDVRGMTHEGVDEEQAMTWAIGHLKQALVYAQSGHKEVTDLIVNTVNNTVGDLIDIDTAMKIAGKQWKKENENEHQHKPGHHHR
jgi:hypothetical protein